MFLGVDGGGTKTAFCLADSRGRIVAETARGTCSYLSVSLDEAANVLDEGVRSVCQNAEITTDDIEYAFFGLSAYGEVSGMVAALDALPEKILGHDRYRCDNDMVCGWAGSLGARDGINVLAGTGSMTYGEYRGRGFRCGGWGEIFGDEGSAYWIGNRGLNAFSRMSDGRLAKGPLYDLIRTQLDLASDLDLVDLVFNQWQSDRARIAGVARIVSRAAHQGDESAAIIQDDAAFELARIAEATCQALVFDRSFSVPVSYSGGVFQDPAMVQALARKLADLDADYVMREPLYSPVFGAALYAARLAGQELQVAPESGQSHGHVDHRSETP